VVPDGQAGFGGDVLEDHGAGFYEAAGGDGALFGVEDRGVGAAGGYTHGLWGGLRGLRGLGLDFPGKSEERQEQQTAMEQEVHPFETVMQRI
jgi:hypothetical protein